MESLEEKIRLTTILFVVNRTPGIVDAKKIPFEQPIPESAQNIQNLGSQEGVELSVVPGKILIGVSMGEGTKQVFFSYDLPVNDRTFEWDYPLPRSWSCWPRRPRAECSSSSRRADKTRRHME